MTKISRTKHITKHGVVKRNPYKVNDRFLKIGQNVEIIRTTHYNGRKGIVKCIGNGLVSVDFIDDKSPKGNLFDIGQIKKVK